MKNYTDEDDSIVLFKNDERRSESDPHYRGQGKTGGLAVWASGWINTSKKDGTKYMKIRLRAKEQESTPKGSIKGVLGGDEISF